MHTSISGEVLPDVATLARLVAEACPELAGRSVQFLAEGWDFAMYEVEGGWLLRLPKREEAEEELAVEAALLPQLAPLLGVAVPEFTCVGAAEEILSRPFAIYRRIEGVAARSVECTGALIAALAPTLGSVLTALHRFPVNRAMACGVAAASTSLQEMRRTALERLGSIEERLDPELVVGCRAVLVADTSFSELSDSVLLHADFNDEHLLLDGRSHAVAGIIDWSDLQIGDPAADFAGLYGWGGEALVEALHLHYGNRRDGDGIVKRARFRAACAELHNLQYWLRVDHTAYAASARAALERIAQH